MDETDPIDVVYTWVDGEAPAVAEQLARYRHEAGPANADSLPGQLRDLGELPFSIRSVRQNMPWVRTIVVVTNGQPVPGLAADGEGLRVITHPEIYTHPGDLPVFNSLSIECNLHAIPGLSERFIYMNNDIFIGRPTARDAFCDAGGADVVLFEPLLLSMRAEGHHPHLDLLNHNDSLLSRVFGEAPRLIPPHTPQLYRRSLCDEVVRTWPAEIAQTAAQRFRSAGSAFFRVLYTYLALYRAYGVRPLQDIMVEHHRQVRLATAEDVRMLTLVSDPDEVTAAFAAVERAMPRFLCVQDHLWDDFATYRAMLERWLDTLFPTPSPHERPGAAA